MIKDVTAIDEKVKHKAAEIMDKNEVSCLIGLRKGQEIIVK